MCLVQKGGDEVEWILYDGSNVRKALLVRRTCAPLPCGKKRRSDVMSELWQQASALLAAYLFKWR